MTQPNLVELAKKGDPQAIAALMNRSLQPKGMTATADLQGNSLEVVLESEQVPNRQALTTFVEKGLHNLGIRSISSVKILGKQTGVDAPAWVQELDIGAASPAVAPGVVPVSTPPQPVPPPRVVTTPPRMERVIPPPPPNLAASQVPVPPIANDVPGVSGSGVTSLGELRDRETLGGAQSSEEVVISGASDSLDDSSLGQPANAAILEPANQSDALLGTQALDNPDPLLDDEENFDDVDPDDVALTGTYALDYPDEPIEEADDLYDIDPNDVDLTEASATDPLFADDDRPLETPNTTAQDELFGDSYVLSNPPDSSSANFLEPEVIARSAPPELETVDDSDEPLESEPLSDEPLEEPLPVAHNLDYHDARLETEYPIREDIELAALEGDQEPQEDAPASAMSWRTVIISLVGIWVLGLLGFIVWLRLPNSSTTEPVAQTSPTSAPAGSAPASSAPASPPPSTSPVPLANPTASATPAPQPSASVQANAVLGGVLPPPAIACQPAQSGQNNQPIEFTNLEFEENVPGADGDYVVGCITNNTNQPIATVSFSFQGNSTQNPAVRQSNSTQLTLTSDSLPPQQTVPFRSAYTVNPEVNNLTIRSISWLPAGAIQAQQSQANVKLTR